MNSQSIQFQLSESLKLLYKDAVVKKIDKDNFLDIHIPSIHISKGTHVYFNTAKGQIKLGFYVRDIDFINKSLKNSPTKLESYSQGLRIKLNPIYDDVDSATEAAADFLKWISLSDDKLKMKRKVVKKTTVKPTEKKSKEGSSSKNISKGLQKTTVSNSSTIKKLPLSKESLFSRFITIFTKYFLKK
jgi:hypothetical protein